jgi:hypothetical protein
MIMIEEKVNITSRGIVEWGTHVPDNNSSIIASTHGNSWVDGMNIENISLQDSDTAKIRFKYRSQ